MQHAPSRWHHGPSGCPGPCWHPDKTEEEGGSTATARASPRESGPWSLRSATGLASRRHEPQVVCICQSDPERQVSPTPQRSRFIKLRTVTAERAALGCSLVSGLGTERHVCPFAVLPYRTHSLRKQTSHPKASGRGNVLSGGKMPNTARV